MLSTDQSGISSCDFGPSAVGGRGILVSERVQKHVSPFSGDVCVPLPVSVEFQDGIKGSDDNLSMDHSDISSSHAISVRQQLAVAGFWSVSAFRNMCWVQLMAARRVALRLQRRLRRGSRFMRGMPTSRFW